MNASMMIPENFIPIIWQPPNRTKLTPSQSNNASNDAKSSKNQLSILMYLLGAVHAYNIVDAYMNGPNGKWHLEIIKKSISLRSRT